MYINVIKICNKQFILILPMHSLSQYMPSHLVIDKHRPLLKITKKVNKKETLE